MGACELFPLFQFAQGAAAGITPLPNATRPAFKSNAGRVAFGSGFYFRMVKVNCR